MRTSKKFNLSIAIPQIMIDIIDMHAEKANSSRADYIRALIARDALRPMSIDTVSKLTYIAKRANVANVMPEQLMQLFQVFSVEPVEDPQFNIPELEEQRKEEAAKKAKLKKVEAIIEENETEDPTKKYRVAHIPELERFEQHRAEPQREEPVEKPAHVRPAKNKGISIPSMSDDDIDLM